MARGLAVKALFALYLSFGLFISSRFQLPLSKRNPISIDTGLPQWRQFGAIADVNHGHTVVIIGEHDADKRNAGDLNV